MKGKSSLLYTPADFPLSMIKHAGETRSYHRLCRDAVSGMKKVKGGDESIKLLLDKQFFCTREEHLRALRFDSEILCVIYDLREKEKRKY